MEIIAMTSPTIIREFSAVAAERALEPALLTRWLQVLRLRPGLAVALTHLVARLLRPRS